FESVDALGVRTGVDGLRVNVVEVELQPRAHGVTQGHLQRVVVAGAARVPGVERRELVLVVLVGRARAVIGSAGPVAYARRVAEHIGDFLGGGLIAGEAIELVVHVLGGGGICRSRAWRTWSCRSTARKQARACGLREQVLPVRDRLDVVDGNSGGSILVEDLRRLEVARAAR